MRIKTKKNKILTAIITIEDLKVFDRELSISEIQKEYDSKFRKSK